MNVMITYNTTSTGGGISPGQENESWPSYEPEYNKSTDFKAYESWDEPAFDSDTVKVNFDPKQYIHKNIYVVKVTYSTGNTFGHSCGNVTFPEIFTTAEEANTVATAINNKEYTNCGRWTGYFESLEGVEVLELILNERWTYERH